MPALAEWALPAALFLGGLSDGPLSIILKTLHESDQMALVGIVTQLGPRITAICKTHVTLRLKAGWLREATAEQASACLAGLAHFAWIDTLSMDLHDLCRVTKLPKTPAEVRVLKLEQVHGQPAPSLEALVRGCAPLETLSLVTFYKYQPSLLIALAKHCPRLKALSVPWFRNLTDEFLIKVVMSCPHLKNINGSGCSKLTDAAIATSCPQLTALDATACKNLTDAPIAALTGCEQLTTLSVSMCKNLTGAAFSALAAGGCPQLKTLDTHMCYRLRDMDIIALARGCPRLETLNLSYCSNLTDMAILALADSCPLLKILNVAGCVNLTDVFIIALVWRLSATYDPAYRILQQAHVQNISSRHRNGRERLSTTNRRIYTY
jgi:hypothetical protein